MKLKYDEVVEKLKAHKIKYYPKYRGIPVDKFEREELLKIIDLFCESIKTHEKLQLRIGGIFLEMEF